MCSPHRAPEAVCPGLSAASPAGCLAVDAQRQPHGTVSTGEPFQRAAGQPRHWPRARGARQRRTLILKANRCLPACLRQGDWRVGASDRPPQWRTVPPGRGPGPFYPSTVTPKKGRRGHSKNQHQLSARPMQFAPCPRHPAHTGMCPASPLHRGEAEAQRGPGAGRRSAAGRGERRGPAFRWVCKPPRARAKGQTHLRAEGMFQVTRLTNVN